MFAMFRRSYALVAPQAASARHYQRHRRKPHEFVGNRVLCLPGPLPRLSLPGDAPDGQSRPQPTPTDLASVGSRRPLWG